MNPLSGGGPQQPAEVLISSGGWSAAGQPSAFKGQMAEMVDFGPKEGTFVQVTERNRTVLCPVPARAHAIVARAIVVQALAPYLVVGVLWAPAADRLCYGFAPIPRRPAARSGCCQLRQGEEPASWRDIQGGVNQCFGSPDASITPWAVM